MMKQVFVILPGEHDILAVDASGEEGHAFVLDGVAVQGQDIETEEITGFNELRQDSVSVIGGVGGTVDDFSVFLDEPHKAGVFDPVTFISRDRENNAFADGQLFRK
jgi:hypothetical protein